VARQDTAAACSSAARPRDSGVAGSSSEDPSAVLDARPSGRGATPWWIREARYNEKLATPDVTIADLIGDIDPIKAATRRLTYADPEVIHFGIVPRTNRGIFAINELPDLAPRIQVGLLNILEERDIQIRGFPIRIPLDILMVFSANPEDYTSRGNIITPLKDRISSQVLTHYPKDASTAVTITRQEAWRQRPGPRVEIPEEIELLIEEIAFAARESELVDQSSGVSARVPIAALELLVSNLERRAVATGEDPVYPRVVDVHMLLPAITGKVEMVYEGEQKGAEVVARALIGAAVKKRFAARFPAVGREVGSPEDKGPFAEIVGWFAAGGNVTLSDEQRFEEYEAELARVPGLMKLVEKHGGSRQERAPSPLRWCSRDCTSTAAREDSRQHGELQGDGEVQPMRRVAHAARPD
jgi:magnesium chelatase subunit I